MAYTLQNQLKEWAQQYENAEFIHNDPVKIPHRYDSRINIEISAFVTAWIAWGSRVQIIKKADFIDRVIFKGEPWHYIMGTAYEYKKQDWNQYKDSADNFYRTFTYGDFYNLCEKLHGIYSKHENMEVALEKGNKKPLEALQSLFDGVKGVPNEKSESACKRLCLFLRWMCRKGSPVDFGLWTMCDPRNLIIPLDTHVHKQAIRLGLTTRKTADILTAIEITDTFAAIFPDDPAKGDFALFGYGVNKNNTDVIKEVTEATQKLTKATKGATKANAELSQKLEDLKIADVLKMPLFFSMVEKEINNIWNSRENARKKAKIDGLKLKAHPIDALHAAGLLVPGEFVVAYAKILDKVNSGLPRAQRDVIETLGGTAFNRTMQKLVDYEKERNNSNGDNKQ